MDAMIQHAGTLRADMLFRVSLMFAIFIVRVHFCSFFWWVAILHDLKCSRTRQNMTQLCQAVRSQRELQLQRPLASPYFRMP